MKGKEVLGKILNFILDETIKSNEMKERNYNELKSKAKMRGRDDIIEQCDEAIEQCRYYKENAQNKKENMKEIFEFDD